MFERPVSSGTCWVFAAGPDRSVVPGVSAPGFGRAGGFPGGAVGEQISAEHGWQIVATGSSLVLGTYGVFGNPTDSPSEWQRHFNGRGTKALRRKFTFQRCHADALAVASCSDLQSGMGPSRPRTTQSSTRGVRWHREAGV